MKGLFSYLQAIWARRHFWLSLVRCDIRARYRGSLLGIAWSMLQPIAMTTILCGVFSTIFHTAIADFAPYLMAGLTYWQFITTTSLLGCHCFFTSECYIRQHPAPMAIYPLRTMLGSAFHFLIGYVLVIGLSLAFHGVGFISVAGLLSLIPTFVLLAAFGWALAIIFGLATVRFRDLKHLSEVGFQALFYLTPIMYGPDQVQSLLERRTVGWMFTLNPFVPILNLIRDPVVAGLPPALSSYLAGTLLTLTTVVVAGLALRSQERKIIFNL
ncbi:MAG TPA: ABC transporter permease [Gemmataceae bacterium]|nr:ABC transporter permease [Gemmataceae bacterium]